MKPTYDATLSRNGASYRYAELADRLESNIRNGTFRAGDKLPSIRRLKSDTGLSVSTIYQAFIELEKRGVIIAKEKSGYYVKPLLEDILPIPQPPLSRIAPKKVTISTLSFALIEAMGDPRILQLGGTLISDQLLPGKALANMIKTTPQKELSQHLSFYEHYMGYAPLRRIIAQRNSLFCGSIAADEMVVTNGCMEAVSLCLQAVARPGDTIVVESPTFPWLLQIIEDFRMYALEIPSRPQEGIDLDQLSQAIKRHPVQAAILIPNFNNPLGFCMSDAHKASLTRMMREKQIPIIEDDIYAELHFDAARPRPLKFHDRDGWILYCSSFSKIVSPGLRVGWTLPGRFLDKVRHLKINQTIAEPTLTQSVLNRYLRSGLYARNLRMLRTNLKNQVANMALAVARHFPNGTKISAPKGGVCLWVQLPLPVDSLELFRRALNARIAVLPGVVCATTSLYSNCIRISCGVPWSKRLDQGLATLADLISELGRVI
jgi:DNA-binding transcriptional MocR family regulator